MRVLHLYSWETGHVDEGAPYTGHSWERGRVDEGAPSTRDILGREDVLMRVLHLHGTFLGERTC